MLSPQLFALFYLGGAAAVALWIDGRFPGLAPRTVRSALIHIGATMVGAQIVVPLSAHFLTGSHLLVLVSACAVAFPALVYSVLAAIWVLRLVHSGLRGRFR